MYFSIDQMNQRKTNRPRTQSSYQKMGGDFGAYSEVMAGGGGGDPPPRGEIKV
jgi:hypothetical protein